MRQRISKNYELPSRHSCQRVVSTWKLGTGECVQIIRPDVSRYPNIMYKRMLGSTPYVVTSLQRNAIYVTKRAFG